MPPILLQIQLFHDGLATIKQGDAFRSQHPFVCIRHDKICLAGLNVKANRTQALYGIDTKQDASFPAGRAENRQVQFQSATVLHGTDREQAGAVIKGVENRCLG